MGSGGIFRVRRLCLGSGREVVYLKHGELFVVKHDLESLRFASLAKCSQTCHPEQSTFRQSIVAYDRGRKDSAGASEPLIWNHLVVEYEEAETLFTTLVLFSDRSKFDNAEDTNQVVESPLDKCNHCIRCIVPPLQIGTVHTSDSLEFILLACGDKG